MGHTAEGAFRYAEAAPGDAGRLFIRNRGLIDEGHQALLSQTGIAIAGTGGDGGLLAERLLRTGIGRVILCDPESFEAANINRQFAANSATLGRNKAEAVAGELRLINPDADIRVYREGLTAENVRQVVSAADILVDEIEYSLPAVSVMLHREARRQGKYVFMGANVGWGASVFCFHPQGLSFEEHFEYDEARGSINPLKYVKDASRSFTPEIQAAILSGAMPVPAVAASVGLVASLLCSEIVLFLTGRKAPLFAPQFVAADLLALSFDKS